jgi:antirestriction protein ArdC
LKRASRLGEEAQALSFLKRFTVFNTDQCDGLSGNVSSIAPAPCAVEPQVEALVRATGIDFRIGGDRAFYCPPEDYVQVPPPAAYFEPINWHRTALHELAHASGHSSRLNRDMSGAYGTKKYAFEEIIAEISAAFCCASLGVLPTVRHADYIGSWLEVLRGDNRAIVRAASQASRAANFLLGFLPDLAAGSTTFAADQDGRDVDPLLEERVRGRAGFCDEPKAERGLRPPVTEI